MSGENPSLSSTSSTLSPSLDPPARLSATVTDTDMSSSFDLTKVTKLNSRNYCNWRNIIEDILILRDLWLHLEAPSPGEASPDYQTWFKHQKHNLAILRLTCEPDVVSLIADAPAGSAAWKTLATTFASKNATNVMRLEEALGSARKLPSQTMSEWISCVKSLVAQLRGVGVVLDNSKVANRILCGLGKEYESMRHALQARSTPLTMDVVTEHLLSWDTSTVSNPVSTLPSSTTPAPTVLSPSTTTPPYWVVSVPSHNNVHHGPMVTAMAMSRPEATICTHCP